MANISTDRKADLLYKVLKGKSQTKESFATYEEGYPTFPRVLSKQVWIQSGEIPTPAPTTKIVNSVPVPIVDGDTIGVVRYHVNVTLTKVAGSGGYSWVDNSEKLKDMIDQERFGESYLHTLTADGVAISPSVGNSVVDVDAGIVTFDSTKIVNGNTVAADVYGDLKITFYKYIGRKGGVLDTFEADGKYKINGQPESLINAGLAAGIISDIGVNWVDSTFVSGDYCSVSDMCDVGNGVIVACTLNGKNVYILRSIDSGVTFNLITKLYPSDIGTYNAFGNRIICTTDGVILCCIGVYNVTTKGYIFRSTDSGLTWESVLGDGANYAGVNSLCDMGNGKILSSLVNTAGVRKLFLSINSGSNWADTGVTVGANIGRGGVCYVGGNTSYIGVGTVLKKFTVSGSSPSYTYTFTNVHTFTSDVASVEYCGNDIIIIGTSDGSIYRSSDYTTFSLIGNAVTIFGDTVAYNIYRINYMGNGILSACCGLNGDAHKIAISKDIGITWSVVYTRTGNADYEFGAIGIGGGIMAYGGSQPNETLPFIVRSSLYSSMDKPYRYDDIIEVDLATTTALPTCSYSGMVLTASANGVLDIDGTAVLDNYKILVKDETGGVGDVNLKKNGVYTVLEPGSSGTPFKLIRSDEFVDALDDTKRTSINRGKRFIVMVNNGTANANTAWFLKTTSGIVPIIDDVTSGKMEFTQVGSGSGSGGGVNWVVDIAGLKGLSTHINDDTAFVYDYDTGKIASYVYDSTSTVVDDSGTNKLTIRPTDVPTDADAGRWLQKDVFSSSDHDHSLLYESKNSNIQSHISNTNGNPHVTTLNQILTSGNDAGSKQITNLADGTADSHAINKKQLDSAIKGLDVHDEVKVKTTINLDVTVTGTFANKILTANSNGEIIIDTVNLSQNDRVLVANQTIEINNGIYYVDTVGTPSTQFVLKRATDFNETTDITAGDYVFVQAGSQKGTGWNLNAVNNGTPILETNPITFTQYSGPTPVKKKSFLNQSFVAETDLTLTHSLNISNFIVDVCDSTSKETVSVKIKSKTTTQVTLLSLVAFSGDVIIMG